MIIAVVFVAALAITTSAVFARYDHRNGSSCGCDQRHRHSDDCCPKVEVDADTNTTVRNYVDVKADTGDNSIYGSSKNYVRARYMPFGYNSKEEAEIETGNADAKNVLITEVEGALVTVDAPRRGTVDIDADTDTYVKNDVEVKADTGDNRIRVSRSEAEIETGDAYADNYTKTSVLGSTVEVK
ncbi:MAG: hypothetical protein UX02_C0002G0194 [Candidatus Moranbacteria bacterium GW2011_GWC1_45_18]|nr:MAG: hypothetical protein UT79_C0001G0267 [Candidatus Moranbacteria bacterium GW2011_GWC2_40_12]KKT32794.1 MAG: hypothetical protein UW19_C0015G0002 [Candidatus Moranbacteria bacterium GW2011_GWF2_44_10]KKT99875.1 MAG: hypothetical protein UX02_C0002G0194 [Candidatus Moranbacteria bacterium GW2011_GWC1_45_18]